MLIKTWWYAMLLLFIICSIISSDSLVLDAQTDVSVRRKDFKTDKSGFEEAWKHVIDGDSYFVAKGYLVSMHLMNI